MKIDRSLVTGARGDDVRSVVIDALVNLSHRIGARVVGEGVETLDDLIGLAELNVDYAQGWVTGVPAERLPATMPEVVRTCRASRRAMMSGDLLASRDGLAGVHIITTALTASTDPAQLREVLTAASAELGVDAIDLSLLRDDGLLHEITTVGDELDRRAYRVSDFPATQEAIRTNSTIEAHVQDPESDLAERELLARDNYASLLLTPVVASGRTLGILELSTRVHRQWTSADIARARTVADHVASSLLRMSLLTAVS